MNVLNRFGCALLLIAHVGMGRAQSNAQITLPQGTVTAGDPFEMPLKLDSPAPCNTQVFVQFVLPGNGANFTAGIPIGPGETSVTLKATPPKDLPGGDYQTQRAYLNPCPGYGSIREFKVPPLTLSLKPFVDTNVYPRSADIALSLTEKQFLDTKIAQLDDLDNQVTAKLEGHGADLHPLRDFLIQIVNSAQDALTVTERQYREQIMKSQDAPPTFFADFRYQYEAILVQLKAPIPGVGAQIRAQQSGQLVYVQQIKKGALAGQPAGPPNLSGTYPLPATAVMDVLKDNRSAYKYVRDTGRITFDIQFNSSPTGAQIYYKKVIDDKYEDYSRPTDVRAKLELATWDFKFHKDGCKDEVFRRINPYQDTDPDVLVVFKHCGGR